MQAPWLLPVLAVLLVAPMDRAGLRRAAEVAIGLSAVVGLVAVIALNAVVVQAAVIVLSAASVPAAVVLIAMVGRANAATAPIPRAAPAVALIARDAPIASTVAQGPIALIAASVVRHPATDAPRAIARRSQKPRA